MIKKPHWTPQGSSDGKRCHDAQHNIVGLKAIDKPLEHTCPSCKLKVKIFPVFDQSKI